METLLVLLAIGGLGLLAYNQGLFGTAAATSSSTGASSNAAILQQYGLPADCVPVAALPGQGALVVTTSGAIGGCNLVTPVQGGNSVAGAPFHSPSTGQYFCGPASLWQAMGGAAGAQPSQTNLTPIPQTLPPSGSTQTVQGNQASAQAAPYALPPQTAQVVFQNRPKPWIFQVDQSFSLLVTGPANAAILASAILNGVPYGTNTPFGSTDVNGQAVITGTFEANDVGVWSELWTVGGVQAPVIEFMVTAAQPGVSGAANFIPASLIHGGY